MSRDSNLDQPKLIISLDTELIWGPGKPKSTRNIVQNSKEARNSILKILDIFEKYQIPATWAIVGHLFRDSCSKEDCLTYKNMIEHGYRKEFYNDPYSNINEEPLYYGKDLVKKIISSPIAHEIGYHTYSHPRFTEISCEMARDEINEAKWIEKKFNMKFKSFVYPGDKIDHVDVLIENGFQIYRGKVVDAAPYDIKKKVIYRLPQTFISKMKAVPVEPKWMNGIWEIPCSMYFCEPALQWSVLSRAKRGLKKAIKENKIFHIYLHPWNLILYERLSRDLEDFMKYASQKRDRGNLEVVTMGELAKKLNENSN